MRIAARMCHGAASARKIAELENSRNSRHRSQPRDIVMNATIAPAGNTNPISARVMTAAAHSAAAPQ